MFVVQAQKTFKQEFGVVHPSCLFDLPHRDGKAAGKGGFTLAPPPPAGSTIFVNSPEQVEKDASENADDDDDFGDFA